LLSLALVSQPELSTVDNQLVWSRVLSKFFHPDILKGRMNDDYSVIACRLIYASTLFAARWYSQGTPEEQLVIQQRVFIKRFIFVDDSRTRSIVSITKKQCH
jgi:hypothetical protein